MTEPALQRSLNLPLLILYGLGTTVGGGIYVLVGAVIQRAGAYAPVSFLVAAVLTTFTAFTFAEISARHPKSAGEAVYVEEGFGNARLAMLVGTLVVAAGLVSSATLAIGFAGYFRVLLPVTTSAAVIGVVILLGLLAAWGIAESVTAAAILTVVEIGGLLLILWVGRGDIAALPERVDELIPPFEGVAWAGILGGAFLAYYAFIGFEDMVNVAEEVKDVQHTMPAAIITTLVITALLYLAVNVVAVLALPPGELSGTEAPLAMIYEAKTGSRGTPITLISVLAVVNGALIQIIMASRVLYGMSMRGWLPGWLGRIHPRTRTPLLATALATVAVGVLALGFAMETLAQLTTIAILVVAFLVNGALLRIKLRVRNAPPPDHMTVPIWVPAVGLVVSFFFAGLAAADLLS